MTNMILKSSTSLTDITANVPDAAKVFDAAKGYQGLLFHSRRYLASHELTHVQDIIKNNHQRLAEYFLRDGALTKGGQISLGEIVDGQIKASLSAGRVYIRGGIHDLIETTLIIPATGTVIIGARLTESVVSWLQDTALKGQAVGTRAYKEAGASAHAMLTKWGFEGDGSEGSLYPIYTVRDGILVDENPPPTVDPYTERLERYDREVHGGYIVNGWKVTAIGPDTSGNQQFSISEGTINVWGRKITRSVSSRLIVKEEPDLEYVRSEPVLCVGEGPHTLNTNFGPISDIAEIQILSERTVKLTHGFSPGSSDYLPDLAVQEIIEVFQDSTIFPASSYSLINNSIKWTGTGPEPSPGSSYSVTYRYYKVVKPDTTTDRSFTVSGAAPNTQALVHYRFKLPRIDAIVVDRYGNLEYVKGISSRLSPQPVEVDATQMKIADVYVVWGGMPTIHQVGTVHIEQSGLRNLQKMIGDLYALVADERLQRDISSRDVAAKLGVFADPLLDDDLRDQGIEQDGAIVNGTLRNPIAAEVLLLEVPGTSLPAEEEVIIEQGFVTAEFKINPYMAFAAPPVIATLEPTVDIWSEEVTNWTSIDTARFVNAAGGVVSNPAIGSQWQVSSQWTEKQVLDSRTEAVEFIRQRPVSFTIDGFGPGEQLVEVTFDGIALTF